MSTPKKPAKKAAKKKVVKKPVKKAAPKQSKQTPEEKRRAEWEVNNQLISEAFFASVLKNKKFPTYISIAKTVKLDEKTVRRHLQDTNMFEDLLIKMRALKDKALLTLAIKAIKGDSHHWTKLFFEVMGEITPAENVVIHDDSITININGKKVN